MTIYYQKIEKRVSPGKINLGLAIVFSIFILSIIYLLQTNASIIGTYKLMDGQKALKQKEEANKKLRMELTKLQSLPYLEQAIKNLNMVSIDKVNYLSDSDNQLASIKN